MKHIIEPFLILTLLSSCSIREDRYCCHCILRLEMQDCSSFGGGVKILLGGNLKQYYYPEASPLIAEFEVPRGETAVCVLSDGPSDSLYACGGTVLIDDEFNHFRPLLKKQFATIDLDPTALLGSNCPYMVLLRGGWNGIDPVTMHPKKEEMTRTFMPEADGRCFISMPRQGDDGAIVQIICSDGVEIEVPLGQLIRARGYDWTAEDLPDMRVALERRDVEISIVVSDWDLE